MRARFSGLFLFLTLGLTVVVAGCQSPSGESDGAYSALADQSYLTASIWNDGQAEVAFYRVRRSRNQYGDAEQQEFVAGSYLVKHRFSPEVMTKVTDGGGTSSFKYAFFYELESGSYQYKRNWVVNVRRKDLRPFKQSFTSFDWCSNLYREIAFPREGPLEFRMRSDDYGNHRDSFTPQDGSYFPAQIPLLVRALDVRARDTLAFTVTMAEEGRHVPARAFFTGTDSLETDAGTFAAERIEITYDEPVPSMIGEESAASEVYWRATGRDRLLLKMRAKSGRYQMELVEHLRTPYWKENLWPRLQRIQERP